MGKPRKVMTIKKVVTTIKKVVKTKKKASIKKVAKKEKNTRKKASIKKVAKKEKSIKKVQKKIMKVNQRKVAMVVAQKVELLVLVALVVQHQSVKAVTIMVQVVTLMHRQKVLQKKNNGSKQRKPQETTSLETLKLSMLMVKLCL